MSLARDGVVPDDYAGWVQLLPAAIPGERLLCVEPGTTRYAEAAAFWFDDVTALHLRSPAHEARFARGELTEERALQLAPGAGLPYADGEFSVVVCRFVGVADARREFARLLPELVRMLQPAGCLYVDIDNPWSYQSDRTRGGCTHSALRRAVTRAGLGHQRCWSQIVEHGRLAEVIPVRGYRASRNAWRTRERVKEWLLAGTTQRWFAPAHAILASRADLRVGGHATLPAAGGPQFAQFLVNPGKCFIRGTDAALMTVVPTRADTITRRRTELAALARLRATQLPVTRLLPQVAREVPHLGRPVFEYQAVDGTTIDLVTPQFEQLLERAFDTLCAFNRDTLEIRSLTADEFETIAAAPISIAAQRYPHAARAAQRLRTALEAQLSGRALPLVWLHGDYKLENLIFGREHHEVRAIIDWELSTPRSLALVDLLYLLAYREITIGAAQDVLTVFANTMLGGHWPPTSRVLLDRYAREFPALDGLVTVCLALFLVHHVAVRFSYDVADSARQDDIVTLMNTLAERLLQQHGEGA